MKSFCEKSVEKLASAATRKRVVILQSNYIPWKGYFDLIRMADEFIIFDTAQYTKRDWRNRNLIKTAHGVKWLTIPVVVKDRYFQRIQDTEISDSSWTRRHWNALQHCYARTAYFADYKDRFESLYLGCKEKYLSQINYRFLAAICEMLDIHHRFTWSTSCPEVNGKTERLVEWCKHAGATEYWSGPSARSYVDERMFTEAGIALRWVDYSDYPQYRQLYPPFEHRVSVVDLLFNEGPNAKCYMKAFP